MILYRAIGKIRASDKVRFKPLTPEASGLMLNYMSH